MADRLRIGVIIGSTRQKRRGAAIAEWFIALAQARPELEVVKLDLLELALPTFDSAISVKVAEQSYTHEGQKTWVAAINGLDGFVWVTPEYNHGYPAALKNAIDTAYTGWNGKPVAMVSYGGISGGTRAVQQLRQVAVELQMAPLRDEVNIPITLAPLDESGKPSNPAFVARANLALDGLIWWADALKVARAKKPMPVPVPLPTSPK